MTGTENGKEHEDSPEVIIVNSSATQGTILKDGAGRRVSQYFGGLFLIKIDFLSIFGSKIPKVGEFGRNTINPNLVSEND